MRELLEKNKEANFRLNRLENKDPSEKISKGEEIYHVFKSYLKEKYPLYILGDDKIVEVLRQYPSDQYKYSISEDKIEFPAEKEEGAIVVDKKYIEETRNAISFEEKLCDRISFYKSELAFQEVLEEVNQFEDRESKIDFLINLKFGNKIQSLPNPTTIEILIDETIDKLDSEEEKIIESECHLKLAPRFKVPLVELIDGIHDSKMFLDERTGAPASLQTLITHFEKLSKTDLSDYYKIRKDAFLSYKRSVQGDSFFKTLDQLQKIKIEKLNNKDGQ